MEKEYRPYGVTDLVLNLHNRINKATMIKVLDELVDEGVLIVKRYGKLSFYCFKEIQLDENMDVVSLETIKEITKEVNEYRIDLNEHRKGKKGQYTFVFWKLVFPFFFHINTNHLHLFFCTFEQTFGLVLTQLKSEPTDSELNILYDELKKENTRLRSMVEKYRSEIEENSLEIESSVIQIERREKALHKKYTSLKKVVCIFRIIKLL